MQEEAEDRVAKLQREREAASTFRAAGGSFAPADG
jgi:hypothetical protein